MTNNLNEYQKQAILQFYKEGVSSKDIGERLGLSSVTINRFLKEMGCVGLRTNSWTKEDDRILMDMFRNGKRSGDVAKVLNRSKDAVIARKGTLGIRKNPEYRHTYKEKLNEMVELRRQGYSYYKIGFALGCTDACVKYVLTEGGYPTTFRAKVWTPEEECRLMELYNKGVQSEIISQELNRTKSSVCHRIGVIKKRSNDTKGVSKEVSIA